MFRKQEPVYWPPEAERWQMLDIFGDPITPEPYPPLWERVWRFLTRRG